VRVLQARFHPRQDGDDGFIVVAHVVWDKGDADDRPTVKPSPSWLASGAPATMLVKLHYLVASMAPETFARLVMLKSQFWSFVEIAPQVPLR
jgi:hypothetical protein